MSTRETEQSRRSLPQEVPVTQQTALAEMFFIWLEGLTVSDHDVVFRNLILSIE